MVPENILKKQKRDEELKQTREDLRLKQEALHEKNVGEWKKKAEKHEQEYKEEERKLIDSKRQARLNNQLYREAEPKVAFAIRIKG